MVCRNPLLAKERARKREDLLRAAETALEAATEATKRNRGEKNISERVGRAVYKMKKHLEIAADTFSWRRNDDSIAAEAALDGFYVPVCRRNSSTLARPLPPTKISVFARSAPLIDLNVRPIHHRLESRVRAHLLLCMLACYVERHMRQQLAPMLFDDEDGPVRTSIVVPKSNSAQRKASSRRTPDGHTVHSFRSLLDDLLTSTVFSRKHLIHEKPRSAQDRWRSGDDDDPDPIAGAQAAECAPRPTTVTVRSPANYCFSHEKQRSNLLLLMELPANHREYPFPQLTHNLIHYHLMGPLAVLCSKW